MEIERRGEVAVVRMAAGKANAMGPELLAGLGRLLDQAEAGGAGAIVLTGYERYFSAGLALPALVGLDRATMRGFLSSFDGFMRRVLAWQRPVVAAVNGHAVAGGCVLALQCDLRIMADGPWSIGLNEVRLGIGLPAAAIEPLRAAVPAASLAPLALEGRLVSPAEALRLGLVDEVVPPERLLDRAVERARELAASPGSGFAHVKRVLRRPVLEAMERHGAVEAERWLDTWFSPAAQKLIGEAVARLAGGKKT